MTRLVLLRRRISLRPWSSLDADSPLTLSKAPVDSGGRWFASEKTPKMAWVTFWVMAVFRIRKRREYGLNRAVFDSAPGHHEINNLEALAIWNCGISARRRAGIPPHGRLGARKPVFAIIN